jgi:hypothetical protein
MDGRLAHRRVRVYIWAMVPGRKTKSEPLDRLDVPLSPQARAALDVGLESARRDIASGRPLTAWIDFTEYAVEDDD